MANTRAKTRRTNTLIRRLIGASLFCLAATNFSAAQTVKPNVQELVRKYLTRTEEYSAAFKNLSAEETKYIENYESDGTLKNYRTIISELVVYQAMRENVVPSEYRSVLKVDGKPLPDAEKRAIKMFEDITKAKSGMDEWERVRKEWAKYDLGNTWWGFTINQGIAIKNSLPYYVFAMLGEEQIAGRKTYIVFYRQVEPSPRYTGPTYLVRSIRKFEPYANSPVMYVGKLWLDAETCQLHREERAMMVYLPSLQLGFATYGQLREILVGNRANELHKLLVARWVLTYQPSEFGVMTPKHIEIKFYNQLYVPKTPTGQGLPELRLGHRTSYDYATFKRFDVSAEESKRDIIKP